MRYEDIHISDSTVYSQFKQLMDLGSVASALQLLENNPQVVDKSTMAEVFNELRERVFGLENVYYTEVEDYMSNLLVQMQNNIDDFVVRGKYSPTEEYFERNFVFVGDVCYYCLQKPPVGTGPTDTGGDTFWLRLGLGGLPGVDGITNIVFKGQYSETATYAKNDIVYSGKTFYYAKQASAGQPLGDNDYWGVFFTANAPYILVSETEPQEGQLSYPNFWFQIV